MVTYTETTYTVTFDSTNPSDNLKKLVHSLADNISQLSIQEETEETSSSHYKANLKYSGHSKYVLMFSTYKVTHTETDTGIVKTFYPLTINIGIEKIGSTGEYTSWYYLTQTAKDESDTSDYLTGESTMTTLNSTSWGVKYTVQTVDDFLLIQFRGVRASDGYVRHFLGDIAFCRLVDYFTSEQLGGVIYVRPLYHYGEGYSSHTYLCIHNGNASLSNSGCHSAIGGKYYYAGANSVASPVVWTSSDYSTIPFYGFVEYQAFLYQVYTGSNSNPLNFSVGHKIEIGGHTFVALGILGGFFARIS